MAGDDDQNAVPVIALRHARLHSATHVIVEDSSNQLHVSHTAHGYACKIQETITNIGNNKQVCGRGLYSGHPSTRR